VIVLLIKSKPAKGFGFPLSGIGTPDFRTRMELSLTETGLLPEATIMLRLPSIIKNIRNEAIIIPVIVAKV
jgi:hypothetical protein